MDHSSVGHNYGHAKRTEESPHRRYDYNWGCDNCGDAGMSVFIAQCPECNHLRCPHCSVTAVKFRVVEPWSEPMNLSAPLSTLGKMLPDEQSFRKGYPVEALSLPVRRKPL